MFRKKRLAAIAFVAALAVTGAAVAYFTGGSGNVTTSGSVGSSSAWTVAANAPTWSGTLTALYPGGVNDTEFLNFTVTNNGNGHQSLANIQPTIPAEANGDAETAAGADIPGCLAAWFTATVDSGNTALPVDIAPAGTYSGKIDLVMPNNSTTNQNACQGVTPAVKITAS